MRDDVPKLADRLFDYAVEVVRVVNALPRTTAGRHVGGQLLRSGTSGAANYEEACAAESRADFIHKLRIALKELRESRFWLRLIKHAELKSGVDCSSALSEAEQLCNIIAQSIITAKSNAPSR